MAARARPKLDLAGALPLSKPPGVTSAHFLHPLKARFARVGHAGTLDPFASGLLLALVGSATRLAALAMAMPKRYRATVLFGRETDTLDPDGKVVSERDPGAEPPKELEAAVAAFTGEILQEPPAYSARKVGGRRAYALAREGREVKLEPRPVTIHAIRIAETAWPEVTLEIECSAGTYVRSLARDLGRALGLPASLRLLERTGIGPFVPLEIAPGEAERHLIPPADLVRAAGLPLLELDAGTAALFRRGRPIRVAAMRGDVGVLAAGALLGLATSDGEGTLRPRLVFPVPPAPA